MGSLNPMRGKRCGTGLSLAVGADRRPFTPGFPEPAPRRR
ncbi:hypothetical protein FB570_102708 [Streptomyces sp. T12]|nr:hypothetical protein FB570_102708 [Streptomyces sp. T12]